MSFFVGINYSKEDFKECYEVAGVKIILEWSSLIQRLFLDALTNQFICFLYFLKHVCPDIFQQTFQWKFDKFILKAAIEANLSANIIFWIIILVTGPFLMNQVTKKKLN